MNCKIGCSIGDVFFYILAYADYLVLLAPSWAGLQYLINLLHKYACIFDMTCNTDKTVCMIFQPNCRHKSLNCEFPLLAINGKQLKFVQEFRHVGHLISSSFSDNADINWEILNLFMRANIPMGRFAVFVNGET